MPKTGKVYIVGAGPGDPRLLSLRAQHCLRVADIVVYDGLVAKQILLEASPASRWVYAGKKKSSSGAALTQEQITAALIDGALAGNCVVRLKGGDPFVFGRGSEEAESLRSAGIAFEIVPGVSSAMAAAAYAGIPLTSRGASASVALVTAHEMRDKASGVDWNAVAKFQTIVIFMGLMRSSEWSKELLAAGLAADTPVAAIHWGTRARQKTEVGHLGSIASDVEISGMRPPVLIVVGQVVNLRKSLNWYEPMPLFGQRIAITRDAHSGSQLQALLSSSGAEAYCCPVTRVSDLGAASKSPLVNVSEYDWIMFSSRIAVQKFKSALIQQGLDSRALAKLRIAAVGLGTAAALMETLGVEANLVGTSGGEDMASKIIAFEGIVKGAKVSSDSKIRVLFPRARGGRDEPMTLLTEAGASVQLWELYEVQGHKPSAKEMSLLASDLLDGGLTALVFYAPSQVRAMVEAISQCAKYLADLPHVFAVGETTAAALRDVGVVPVVAESPTSTSMHQAIVRTFASDNAKA